MKVDTKFTRNNHCCRFVINNLRAQFLAFILNELQDVLAFILGFVFQNELNCFFKREHIYYHPAAGLWYPLNTTFQLVSYKVVCSILLSCLNNPASTGRNINDHNRQQRDDNL